MQHCEFMFQGERLQALQHGALYRSRKRLLAVADLHMGKSARMARTGGLHPLLRGQRGPKRRRGLPVGSGVVENACKHIVGIRWSKAGANALLSALSRLENLRWPDFLDWRACRTAAA